MMTSPQDGTQTETYSLLVCYRSLFCCCGRCCWKDFDEDVILLVTLVCFEEQQALGLGLGLELII